LTTETIALDWDLNVEASKVNDSGKHGKSSDEVHHVGKTLTPESLPKGPTLIIPGKEEVEKGDDGTLELRSTASIDGSG
jgi:hypothetical protein